MQFGLLGEVEARGPDGPVDIGHPRQRSVLAALLADANRLVSTDQLLDRVWGDRPPPTARGTLFTYLTRLRQAVAPVPIERRSGGYQITIEPGTLDVDRFTDLVTQAHEVRDDRVAAGIYQQALELWRGEPLPDLDTPWANDVRERLGRMRFAAELDHVDVRLRLGEHDAMLADLGTSAARHPMDERVAGQLMLALYRSGRTADALAHYEGFRRRVGDELGADPGPRLRELHRQVLADEVGPPGRRASPPRQLPPPPPSFTGRAAELASLDQQQGTVVISAIGGGGGIGKTSLALQWAHMNANHFPDGQLFVNLRGFDPSGRPATPSIALRGLLGALGVSATDVPADVDAQTGLYRSLVAGRRMLVLLDNAADTAQVRPLLPGSASVTTLVTSRHPLVGLVAVHGARAVRLDVLNDEEAYELLAERLGEDRMAAEPDAVAELVAHCAGLPLALGIVAARAIVEPDLPLAVLAGQLRDHATRLDGLDTGESDLSLRAVFALSHQALKPGTARLAALLGLAPGPDISAPAVDALAGESASDMLRELESAHLIAQFSPGRYRMHDLVRLDAAERALELPDDLRDTALRRLVDFYLRTAHAADRLIAPTRPPVHLSGPEPERPLLVLRDEAAAWAWMDAEHTCLMAAQQFAAEHGWHTQVWELALVTDTLHWNQGRVADHLTVLRAAVDAAEAAGGPQIQGRLHANLGQAATRAGRLDESMEHIERALALMTQAGDLVEQAHCHLTIGQAWGQRGDNHRALHHARQALDRYRASGQSRWEANALNQVGYVLALLGRFDEAREHCLAALDLQEVGQILDSLGYIDEHSGRLTDAVGWYRRAVTVFGDDGDMYNVASTLIQLGRAYVASHASADARAAWQQALQLCRAQNRATEADRLAELLADLP
jgi:DNA-binding SARP family transcriptional activator